MPSYGLHCSQLKRFLRDCGHINLTQAASPYFKGSTSKDLTTISGSQVRLLVFEGFFDFLSYVERFGRPPATILVLNSVSLASRAIEQIQSWAPQAVELYRDNDPAGAKLLQRFCEELPDTQIVDRAEQYAGYDDLNAWHSHRKKHALVVR